ncbi:MAG TPA: AAA family ATPase [Tepidisphaeraceae bacterium]|jgi:pilus assembly protein CpaE|nr:AAA family ATPase [Tepidisphaeraceae bacterium]
MFVQLHCVVVDSDVSNRQEMANFLSNHGVNVVAQLPTAEQLSTVLVRREAAQLVVINLDPNPQETLKRVGQLVRQFPNTSFFVMSQTVDAQILMEAMHMGVREFVPLPIVPEKFAAGIERVASLHGMGRRARMVQIIPTIGGCGSTTVSCNIAASLAKDSKTVLLDMDLVRGTVASSFDIRPKYTISDIMNSAERLDNQLLDNALAIHEASGLAILARPDLPEDTQRVNQAGINRLMGVLQRMYDYVVIDSLMSVDPLYSGLVQAADMNIIVMQLNVPSARNCERFLGTMRRMGIDSAKIKIVVNRYVKKGWDIAPEEVERSLGLKISWMIPNDFKNAIAAINFGSPVVMRAPRAEMSLSLSGLAEVVHGKAKAA